MAKQSKADWQAARDARVAKFEADLERMRELIRQAARTHYTSDYGPVWNAIQADATLYWYVESVQQRRSAAQFERWSAEKQAEYAAAHARGDFDAASVADASASQYARIAKECRSRAEYADSLRGNTELAKQHLTTAAIDETAFTLLDAAELPSVYEDADA